MQVVLDIKAKSHWKDLLQIIEKHNISFHINNENSLSEEEREKNWEILMRGVKFDDFDKFMEDFEAYRKDWEIIRKGIKVDDPEQFMKDFEESRKDRELPHHLLNT